MRKVILLAIRFYQLYISPYKGYRCAHAVYYQGDSCSKAITKIIQRRGIWKGYQDIRNQFDRCSCAYQALSSKKKDKKRRRKKKDSKCDYIDIPCDLPCDCSI